MTMPATGWIGRLLKPQPAPIPWARAIRAAVAIPLPVGIGMATGQVGIGLVVAMGALSASMTDAGGPYRARLQRLTIVAFSGAAGFLVGNLAFGHPLATLLAVVGAGLLSGIVSVLGNNASVAGLQFLLYAAIASGLSFGTGPAWTTPLLFLAGAVWAVLLAVIGGIGRRDAPESLLVANVYRAIANLVRAVGDADAELQRQQLTVVLNAAYDAIGSLRMSSAGHANPTRTLLVRLNAATPAIEAATALVRSGQPVPAELADVLDRMANIITGSAHAHRVPIPRLDTTDPAALALVSGLHSAADTIADGTSAAQSPTVRPSARQRLMGVLDLLDGGWLTWAAIVRIALCLAIAETLGLFFPIDRSYWVTLTVAVTLKPDFGSVFARSVQRGVGTIVGVVIGSVLVVVLPFGLPILIAMAVFAFLMPVTLRRNYGLFSTVLTPLVVLLLDLAHGGDEALILARLIDTAIGCAIVLVFGYLIWPDTWRARTRIGARLATSIDTVAAYLDGAFGADGVARSAARRRAYRQLSDLRTSFQQTMAEPPPISRRAVAWWPAIVALERVTDAVTAAAVRAAVGGPRPGPSEVGPVVAAMEDLAEAVREGREPGERRLSADESLSGVVAELKVAQSILVGDLELPEAGRASPSIVG